MGIILRIVGTGDSYYLKEFGKMVLKAHYNIERLKFYREDEIRTSSFLLKIFRFNDGKVIIIVIQTTPDKLEDLIKKLENINKPENTLVEGIDFPKYFGWTCPPFCAECCKKEKCRYLKTIKDDKFGVVHYCEKYFDEMIRKCGNCTNYSCKISKVLSSIKDPFLLHHFIYVLYTIKVVFEKDWRKVAEKILPKIVNLRGFAIVDEELKKAIFSYHPSLKAIRKNS